MRRAARPLVVVTGPDRGGAPAWICTRLMIWWAGGRARRVCPAQPEVPADYAALVLGGGADIHPSRYKEKLLPELQKEARKPKKSVMKFLVSAAIWLLRRLASVDRFTVGVDLERDQLELHLLEDAVRRQIPVLGLCRGGQLINVYFGGSLHQDLKSFYTEKPNLRTIRPKKRIEIEPRTQLAKAIGRTQAMVNSLHKQSVHALGAGLKVSAREPNGVVQAIEHPGFPFLVGVQWHPEFMPFSPGQRRLFRHFIASASF